MGAVIPLISRLAAMVSTKGKPKPDDQEDRSWIELTSETTLSKPGWREQCRNDLQHTETVQIPQWNYLCAWVAQRATLALYRASGACTYSTRAGLLLPAGRPTSSP